MLATIEQTTTACVMCGTPLRLGRPAGTVLCLSQLCAAQHAALLPVFKCAHCTRPLTASQRASGHCDGRACRDAEMRVRRAAALQIETDLVERLVRQRELVAAERGIPPTEQATYRLAILPYNDDEVSSLPAQRRARHEAHLRAQLARARVRRVDLAWDAATRSCDPSDERSSPPQSAESRLLHAACASCRGWCCRQAGDDAFLTDETMLDVLDRFPTLDDDAIVARYLQHIGTHTMTRGCVYQGELGCTLSPVLRADICHSFHCTGLRMMKDQYADGAPMRAWFVHRRGGHVTSDRFVEISDVDDPPLSKA
ncbi:MAG: hypothetical protein H7099_16145 [Gemmatimonadaceae bacterium]|nr:hypothetical protein [Gemmatimonadaceae bacterium]